MDNIKISNQKKSKRTSLLIFILFLALVISLGGLLGWALYSLGFGISPRHKMVTYYAVCLGEFDTKEQAESFGQGLRLKGGAGFVTDDNKVLASVYTSKSQAENVVSNNPDYTGKVVTIEINAEYKNERKILNNLIDICIDYVKNPDSADCIKSLDDIVKRADELDFVRAGFKSYLTRMVSVVKNMNSNLGYGLNYLCVSGADFLSV